MVEAALILGIVGTALGASSIVYARSQAAAARRQAQEAARLARLDSSFRAMERLRQSRRDLFDDERFREEYMAANPELAAAFDAMGGVRHVIGLRNFMDAVQDTYYLRKAGVLEEHHWRSWASGLAGVARAPTVTALFENAAARNAFSEEFERDFRALLATGTLRDPIERP